MARTAFLFPGQGAQTVGMAVGLCQTHPAARALFDKASSILGYDLLDLCGSGPKEKLDSTVVSQPAIYIASLAALEQLRHSAPDTVAGCVACAGLSLGEYTALTFAGALRVAAEADKGANILCMLPDTGERYLSTPLFADVSADMNEEELMISRSTPGAQLKV